MRVYIAGNFELRKELLVRAQQLIERGHEITSTWLHEPSDIPAIAGLQNLSGLRYAIRDLGELAESDILILDTREPTSRGGREVEWGLALGTGLITVSVGPVRNVFHTLANKRCETWDECVAYLTVGGK